MHSNTSTSSSQVTLRSHNQKMPTQLSWFFLPPLLSLSKPRELSEPGLKVGGDRILLFGPHMARLICLKLAGLVKDNSVTNMGQLIGGMNYDSWVLNVYSWEFRVLRPAEIIGNRLFISIPANIVPLVRGSMFESKFSIWPNLQWWTQLQNTDIWDLTRGQCTVCPRVHRNSVAHLFSLIWWHIQNLNVSANSAHAQPQFKVCATSISVWTLLIPKILRIYPKYRATSLCFICFWGSSLVLLLTQCRHDLSVSPKQDIIR